MPDELYATAEEERLHRHAMQRLADETGWALSTVRAIWEEELAELAADATVRNYLPIFAWRRTREVLKTPHPNPLPQRERGSGALARLQERVGVRVRPLGPATSSPAARQSPYPQQHA